MIPFSVFFTLYHSLYTYRNGGFLVNFGCRGKLRTLESMSARITLRLLNWFSLLDLDWTVCFLFVSGLISSVPFSLLTSLLTSLWFVIYCWGSMDFALARPSFKLSYFISEDETLMLLLSFGKACIGSEEATSVT